MYLLYVHVQYSTGTVITDLHTSISPDTRGNIYPMKSCHIRHQRSPTDIRTLYHPAIFPARTVALWPGLISVREKGFKNELLSFKRI